MKIMAKYLSIVLGFMYCLFIIWNRLFRERVSSDLFSDYTIKLILLYLLFFSICFFVFAYYLKKILKIVPKYHLLQKILKIPFITKFSNKIIAIWESFIVNAPKNFYEFLYNYIYIRPFIDKCCYYIYYLELTRFFNYFLIFKYSFFIILSTIFIHNILFLHNLEYFYKYIWLLLIPTLFDLLVFSILNLAKKNQKIIEERIKMIPINDGLQYQVVLNLDNKNNPLLQIKDDAYLTECMEHNGSLLLDYFHSSTIINNYYTKEKKVQPYIYVYVFGLYTIGWGYVLFNIFLLNFL